MTSESIFTPFIQIEGQTVKVHLPYHHPCFADHHVRAQPVLPGASYLDLVCAGAMRCFPGFTFQTFEDCLWLKPFLGNVGTPQLEIEFTQLSDSFLGFNVKDKWQVYANGHLNAAPRIAKGTHAVERIRRELALAACKRFSHHQVYEAFSDMGIDYGTFFKKISHVDIRGNESLALLSRYVGADFCMSNLLDCSFQSGMAISIGTKRDSLMPFSLGQLVLYQPLEFSQPNDYWVATDKSTEFRTDIGVFSQDGQLLLSVHDLGVKPSRL